MGIAGGRSHPRASPACELQHTNSILNEQDFPPLTVPPRPCNHYLPRRSPHLFTPSPPTALSIVRRIKSKTAETHCVPGAKVVDVVQQIPSLLSKHPHIKNIILHLETDNTTKQQSDVLKQDFNHLYNKLKNCLYLRPSLLIEPMVLDASVECSLSTVSITLLHFYQQF